MTSWDCELATAKESLVVSATNPKICTISTDGTNKSNSNIEQASKRVLISDDAPRITIKNNTMTTDNVTTTKSSQSVTSNQSDQSSTMILGNDTGNHHHHQQTPNKHQQIISSNYNNDDDDIISSTKNFININNNDDNEFNHNIMSTTGAVDVARNLLYQDHCNQHQHNDNLNKVNQNNNIMIQQNLEQQQPFSSSYNHNNDRNQRRKELPQLSTNDNLINYQSNHQQQPFDYVASANNVDKFINDTINLSDPLALFSHQQQQQLHQQRRINPLFTHGNHIMENQHQLIGNLDGFSSVNATDSFTTGPDTFGFLPNWLSGISGHSLNQDQQQAYQIGDSGVQSISRHLSTMIFDGSAGNGHENGPLNTFAPSTSQRILNSGMQDNNLRSSSSIFGNLIPAPKETTTSEMTHKFNDLSVTKNPKPKQMTSSTTHQVSYLDKARQNQHQQQQVLNLVDSFKDSKIMQNNCNFNRHHQAQHDPSSPSLVGGSNECRQAQSRNHNHNKNSIQSLSTRDTFINNHNQSFQPSHNTFTQHVRRNNHTGSRQQSNQRITTALSFDNNNNNTAFGRFNNQHHTRSSMVNKLRPFEATQQQSTTTGSTSTKHTLATKLQKSGQVELDMHGGQVVNSDGSERFSRKVFVGGLPPDIDEEEIKASFRRFGSLLVDWPHKAESKSYFPPKGYAFLLFHEESSVQSLIDACIQEEDKLYLCVSSPTIQDKPVQIRPWRLSDADHVLDSKLPLDPRKTVFVGGVPRPLKASELAIIMNDLYGGVCYAGIDTDPELKYPKGAGRVAFTNHRSYIAAISARFVHLQHSEIDKRVEVKPYVLDDQFCDECTTSTTTTTTTTTTTDDFTSSNDDSVGEDKTTIKASPKNGLKSDAEVGDSSNGIGDCGSSTASNSNALATASNQKFAPFFCASITCLRYYCESCWSIVHSSFGREFHKPLVKEGSDRPRSINTNARWN